MDVFLDSVNRVVRRLYAPPFRNVLTRLGIDDGLRNAYHRMERELGPELEYRCSGDRRRIRYGTYRCYDTMRNTIRGEDRVLSDLVATLDEGDTFFDVGAHAGVYSVIVSLFVELDEVVAFEPGPERVDRLRTNVRLNNLDVRSNLCALSNYNGTASFSEGGFLREDGSGSVRVVSGDEFLRRQPTPPPDAIKIDAEGLEYQIVEGFQDTFRAKDDLVAYVEVHLPDEGSPSVHDYGHSPEDLHELLEDLGFELEVMQERERDYHLKAVK